MYNIINITHLKMLESKGEHFSCTGTSKSAEAKEQENGVKKP